MLCAPGASKNLLCAPGLSKNLLCAPKRDTRQTPVGFCTKSTQNTQPSASNPSRSSRQHPKPPVQKQPPTKRARIPPTKSTATTLSGDASANASKPRRDANRSSNGPMSSLSLNKPAPASHRVSTPSSSHGGPVTTNKSLAAFRSQQAQNQRTRQRARAGGAQCTGSAAKKQKVQQQHRSNVSQVHNTSNSSRYLLPNGKPPSPANMSNSNQYNNLAKAHTPSKSARQFNSNSSNSYSRSSGTAQATSRARVPGLPTIGGGSARVPGLPMGGTRNSACTPGLPQKMPQRVPQSQQFSGGAAGRGASQARADPPHRPVAKPQSVPVPVPVSSRANFDSNASDDDAEQVRHFPLSSLTSVERL